MPLFETSDVANVLKGSTRASIASARIVNNAVRKSFRNKQMLKSTQQFSTEDLVDQLKQVANDALRLEKALGELRRSDPKNGNIRNYKNLLDSLNAEKDMISKRLNEALASRSVADDVVSNISKNKVPLRRGTPSGSIPNRRTTLGGAGLNVLGAAISVAGYINNRRNNKPTNAGGNNLSTSPSPGSANDPYARQNLKISRDTYARDTEFQAEFKKDYDATSDKIIRRLDKMLEKLDKLKLAGGGGSSGGSDIDIDLDKDKKERRRGRGRNRSRFGLRAGAAIAGTAGLVNGAKVIDSEGKEQTIEMNPIADAFKFLTDPKVEGAFQSMRDTAREFLGLSTAKPNTNTATPSSTTVPSTPTPTAPAIPPTSIIPQGQNFGGMPGLPRLNTARPLSTAAPVLSVLGGGIAPGIKTNETDIDVKPQATVIINTRDLEIKGVATGVPNPVATIGSNDTVLGGLGGGIGSGGIYSGSGAGVGAIMGSRGGGRGQAFTPQGMQRQSITTNAFGNQPVMTLPSDVAGQGTAGGGIANPYGFAGGFSAGNMGSASQLPGNVTSQSIGPGGAYPKFLGPTSGGALGGLISSGEGGYGSYNRGIAGDTRGAKIDFSQMTVSELMQRQSLSPGDPNRIFAFGKYQVIPSTMKGAVAAMGLDPNAKVTPQLQEEIYRNYLISQKRPEVKDYITAQNDDPSKLRNAQQGLAKEFASVADPDTGVSRYGGVGGNKASISADKTSSALQEERRRYQENIKKGMKPEEAWSALSNPQGMDSTQGGNMAGGAPTVPEARQGETPGQLAARIKSLNPNIGNGECVALAKQAVGLDATPGANSVSDWRKGESATARELPIGTPVATFMDRQGNDSNLYDGGQGTGISRSKNGGLGTTHAAVVAGYEKDSNGKITGMQVWEQWNGSGGPRLKTYPVDPSKPGADNAGNFYAINDSRGNPLGGTNNPRSREAMPTATDNSGPVYDPTKTFGTPMSGDTTSPAMQNALKSVTPANATDDLVDRGNKFQASREGFAAQALGTRGFSSINPTGAGAFTLPDGTVVKSNIELAANASHASIERNLDGTYGANHSPTPEGATGNVDTSSIADAGVFGQNVDKAKQDYINQGQLRPGESFQDWIKRRESMGFNDDLGGVAEGQGKGSKFKQDEFSMNDMNYKLQENYRKSQIPGTTESYIQNDIEQGVSRDEARRARQRIFPDEFTPNAGPMSLEEIRRLNSSDGITPNASTNGSYAGAARQSAAPPPADTPAPNPSDNGGGSGGSSGGDNSSKQNNPSDQKAVGDGTTPSISEIPVKHDDLGLAVINSYDV